MAVSGVTVLVAVTVADAAGPFVGGMLSSAPILLAIMAPSIHRSAGPDAAAQFARAALTSGLATVSFLLVLDAALEPLGAPAAFALALAGLVLVDRLAWILAAPRLPRLTVRGPASGPSHGIRAGLQ